MITEIEQIRGKTDIYIDGIRRFTVRAHDAEKAKLSCGMTIESETIAERLCDIQRADCYEAALCVLDVCAQTRSSLRRKLLMKGYLPEVCDETVSRLTENGLIDEKRYSQRIVESEIGRSSGIRSARRKLIAKGIDADDAEEALNAMDESQQLNACRTAVQAYLRRYRDLETREAKQKTAQALARKGFSWDICEIVIDENFNK